MKLSLLLIPIIFCSFYNVTPPTSSIVTEDPCDEFVTLLSQKMDICYFKLCKDHTGSLVEVYSGTDSLLISNRVQSTKFLVDFYFEKPDKYTIKIKYEGLEKKFSYEKLTPPPLAVAHVDYHIVITEQ
jgi:hypothetical protein